MWAVDFHITLLFKVLSSISIIINLFFDCAVDILGCVRCWLSLVIRANFKRFRGYSPAFGRSTKRKGQEYGVRVKDMKRCVKIISIILGLLLDLSWH